MKALIVGGTGPSGPFLANGLIERGYKVTIFHRGTHEIPEIVPEVAHIHGDPHFRETIEAALGDRTFDVVIATYGRRPSPLLASGTGRDHYRDCRHGARPSRRIADRGDPRPFSHSLLHEGPTLVSGGSARRRIVLVLLGLLASLRDHI
jgi:uncharacterized protein YbjT (DUF2867 family)